MKKKMGIGDKILIQKIGLKNFNQKMDGKKFGVLDDKIPNRKTGENRQKNYFSKNILSRKIAEKIVTNKKLFLYWKIDLKNFRRKMEETGVVGGKILVRRLVQKN